MNDQTSPESVSAYMHKDFEQLMAQFSQFEYLLNRNIDDAKLIYEEWVKAFKRHIRQENSLLFPLYENNTRFEGDSPTDFLRREHVKIEDLLDAIQLVLNRDDTVNTSLLHQFKALFMKHIDQEEAVIYRSMDDVLSRNERKEFLKAMARDEL